MSTIKKEPLHLRSDEIKCRIVAKYPGPAWVILDEVRDGTGYGACRSADAIAFGVWPSRGLQVVGFEVKSSRQDWLNELKNPSKAESIAQFCDQWWIVTGEGVAKIEEIPATWGWYVAEARGLKMMKPATDMAPKEMGRSFLMSIVRNISRCYVPISDVEAQVAVKLEAAVKSKHDSNSYRLRELEDMAKRVKKFSEVSGIDLSNEYGYPPKEVGSIVKSVLGWHLKYDVESLANVVKKIQEIVEAINKFPPFMLAKKEKELDV